MTKLLSIKSARIISILFVPPSFTLIIFTVLAFVLERSSLSRYVVISTALIFGFILPVLMFSILKRRGLIADIDAKIKEERTFPFLLSILFYASGLIIFIHYSINIISIAFWFCYISNTLLVIVINKFWKISAHMMGASGPFAALIFVFGYYALPFLLLLVAIGWARIKLECHNLNQVLAGAVLAFLSTYTQIFLISKLFGNA